MEPKNHIIKLENVSVGYQQKKQQDPILENINITIEQGKLIGIIGTNGSGKSTLLRTLARQQKNLSGTISIAKKPIESYSIKNWAKQVSWVHTENSIPNNLLVKELVALGRQPHTNWLDKLNNEDIKKINEALRLTNLKKLEGKKCHTLSDGQLQKAFIARAICQDTPIIFLDEPTTHLDISNKVETLKLLHKLCKDFGKTIVFSTHEIELCLQVCDYMMAIDKNDVFLKSIENLISSELINSIFRSPNLYFDNRLNTFKLK